MENNYKNIREIVINNPLYEFSGNLDAETRKEIFQSVENLIMNKGTDLFRKKSLFEFVELLRISGKRSGFKDCAKSIIYSNNLRTKALFL